MSGVATAVIGSAVVGAYASNQASNAQAKAAKSAANASAQAAAEDRALQERIYQQTQAQQAPWRGAGELGLSALSYGMGLTPTGYLPGMTSETAGMVGTQASNAADVAKFSQGGDQWEVVSPAGYGREMQVRNTATGETRSVPVLTEKNGSSLKRWTIDQAVAGGWGLSGENAPQAGAIIAGPMAKPSAAQIAQMQPSPSAQPAQQGGAPSYAAATGLTPGNLLRDFTMADYQADPGYAFRQQQGMQGIERGAAARGGLLSGAALKGIERFGQDLASQEYGNAYNRFNANQTNRFNRLASLSGIGQTANAALQNAGQNFANATSGIIQGNAFNQGNAMLAAGQARASGYSGIGNALSGAVANWPQQQQQGYQVPRGYQLGTGTLGNQYAMSQGYQPLDYGTANAGYYD